MCKWKCPQEDHIPYDIIYPSKDQNTILLHLKYAGLQKTFPTTHILLVLGWNCELSYLFSICDSQRMSFQVLESQFRCKFYKKLNQIILSDQVHNPFQLCLTLNLKQCPYFEHIVQSCIYKTSGLVSILNYKCQNIPLKYYMHVDKTTLIIPTSAYGTY